MTLPSDMVLTSLPQLEPYLDGNIEMSNKQYVAYKTLIYEWYARRPDPMLYFKGSKIAITGKEISSNRIGV